MAFLAKYSGEVLGTLVPGHSQSRMASAGSASRPTGRPRIKRSTRRPEKACHFLNLARSGSLLAADTS